MLPRHFPAPIPPQHVLCGSQALRRPDCGPQTGCTKAPSPHLTPPGLRESGAEKEGRWAAPARPPPLYRESGSGARSPSPGTEPGFSAVQPGDRGVAAAGRGRRTRPVGAPGQVTPRGRTRRPQSPTAAGDARLRGATYFADRRCPAPGLRDGAHGRGGPAQQAERGAQQQRPGRRAARGSHLDAEATWVRDASWAAAPPGGDVAPTGKRDRRRSRSLGSGAGGEEAAWGGARLGWGRKAGLEEGRERGKRGGRGEAAWGRGQVGAWPGEGRERGGEGGGRGRGRRRKTQVPGLVLLW